MILLKCLHRFLIRVKKDLGLGLDVLRRRATEVQKNTLFTLKLVNRKRINKAIETLQSVCRFLMLALKMHVLIFPVVFHNKKSNAAGCMQNEVILYMCNMLALVNNRLL